jgi:uncharacterized protein
MEKPEKRIADFIEKHHVLTLATSSENQPWCANCFYAYLEDENMLVFTSDEDTRHVAEVSLNQVVAGSIVLETSVVGKIQGIQFAGIMEKPTGELAKKVNLAYLKRFPFAALMNTSLWVIKLNYIKMTDNRLGFGKKLIWER